MAISIDHTTSPRTIFVPQADLTLISGVTYSLDIETFHNAVRTLMTLDINDVYPNTHNHTRQGTLGAVTYPRRLEVTTEYQVEFEDGQYRVRLINGDNNIEDVQVVNQVAISTFNSAGNSVAQVGAQIWDDEILEDGETMRQAMRLIRAAAAGQIVQLTDGSYLIKSKDGLKDRIDGSLGTNNSRDIDAIDSS